MRIRPFRALSPPANLAQTVASPPYDVVDTDQARALAQGNEFSFLHVVRPEIDLPPGTDLYDDAVYAKARENLDRFVAEGALVRDPAAAVYLYEVIMGDHHQTGLVTTCHADDYVSDVIKKHERTLQAKEDDRTRHVDTLNAHTGPVFLTYRDEPGVDALVEKAKQTAPTVDFTADDGNRHVLWRVKDAAPYIEAFAAIPVSYVADGHHRSASAARVASARAAANPNHQGDEPYNWFLAVLFPASQLQILAYNRIVADLNGLSAEAFLEQVATTGFRLAPNGAPTPSRATEIGMYLDGSWYQLSWTPDGSEDAVAGLDVSQLQQRLLAPILGVDDPRTNKRIRFMGGIHGPEGLQRAVDEQGGGVAFSLAPTSVDQLMAIADADQIMPPKSTWFEPKLRSGLFVNVID